MPRSTRTESAVWYLNPGTPAVADGDKWDCDLERLPTATTHPAFSALDLVPAAGELAVRRAVHGFGDEAAASLYAVENGWRDFSVQPTRSLPLELRQDAP